jgi:hypothetical protein
VINLKIAKALGPDVPLQLKQRAERDLFLIRLFNLCS